MASSSLATVRCVAPTQVRSRLSTQNARQTKYALTRSQKRSSNRRQKSSFRNHASADDSSSESSNDLTTGLAHDEYLRSVAATPPPAELGALIAVLQAQGATPVLPSEREGLHPLCIPLARNSDESVTCLKLNVEDTAIEVVNAVDGVHLSLLSKNCKEYVVKAMVVEEAEAERLRAALYKAEDLADLAKLPSSILQKASSRLASLAAAAQPTAPARLARHASKANAKIKWRKDTPAKYTDWTIKLMGHEYTVHRIILDYWDYWNRVFSQPGASGETDLRLSLGANSGQADFTVQRTTPAAFEWLLDFWYDPDGCTDVSAVGGEELIVLWALAGEFQVLEQVRPLPRLSLFRLSPLSP